jgi:DNA-binding transcriptional MerR regulator
MFSLEELSSEAARELRGLGLYGQAPDARVSAVPDARTIRYYTTLGLLDRPKIENRQARYGERHLLQLVAIKALQSRDMPLAEIQQALYGRSDDELRQIVESLPRPLNEGGAPALVWREVILEPGLKLMAEANWVPRTSGLQLEDRIRAAIVALDGGRR